MRKRILEKIFLLGLVFSVSGCTEEGPYTHGLYMLLDTSGTYTQELKQAQRVIHFSLSKLNPGDTFAVARVDTGSFSEKDIIHKQTFEDRPSMANEQKRKFREKIDAFVKRVKPSKYTDITGGILQATEYLNEVGTGKKTIMIFSDMKEEVRPGYVRNIPFQLDGFRIVALNVTKLRSDNIDPRQYMQRMEEWEKRVEAGGGKWKIINDLQRLEPLFED